MKTFLDSKNECEPSEIDKQYEKPCTEIGEKIIVPDSKQINIPKSLFATLHCEVCNEYFKSERFQLSIKYAKTATMKYINVYSHYVNLSATLYEKMKNQFNFDWNTCEDHKDVIETTLGREIVTDTIKLWCRNKNKFIRNKKGRLLEDDIIFYKTFQQGTVTKKRKRTKTEIVYCKMYIFICK